VDLYRGAEQMTHWLGWSLAGAFGFRFLGMGRVLGARGI
jgi:hypothetical protein